jgi:hypothetical protein
VGARNLIISFFTLALLSSWPHPGHYSSHFPLQPMDETPTQAAIIFEQALEGGEIAKILSIALFSLASMCHRSVKRWVSFSRLAHQYAQFTSIRSPLMKKYLTFGKFTVLTETEIYIGEIFLDGPLDGVTDTFPAGRHIAPLKGFLIRKIHRVPESLYPAIRYEVCHP